MCSLGDADGHRASPATAVGSEPFLLKSSLPAAVWTSEQNDLPGLILQMNVSAGRLCHCGLSALFVHSLQYGLNHKGGVLSQCCPMGHWQQFVEITGMGGLWSAKLSLLNAQQSLARWWLGTQACQQLGWRQPWPSSSQPTQSRKDPLKKGLELEDSQDLPHLNKLLQLYLDLWNAPMFWDGCPERWGVTMGLYALPLLFYPLIPVAGNIIQAEQDKSTNNLPVL